MTDENPFAGENPFRKLDKKKFRTIQDKKNAQHPNSGVHRIRDDDTKEFAQAMDTTLSPEENQAFINAMTGVAPLGVPQASPQKQKASKSQGLENLGDRLRTSRLQKNAPGKTPGAPVDQKGEAGPEVKQDTPIPSSAAEPKNSLSVRMQPSWAQDVTAQLEARANEEHLASNPECDEEMNAFAQAMRDVKPLAGKGRDIPQEVTPTPVAAQKENNPLQDFMEGKLEFALASTREYVEGHVIGLDLMTVGKLQAGQFSPEAHIDLHGLNALQAFEALVGFFRSAYFKGHRTVLVVPGRGLNSPQGIPVLREKVQDWFTQEPFRRVILAFCTAKPSDGGAGALYVLLRKFRKGQGKVYWDRRPADPDLM